jgi:chromosomal replication initiation ATPase DnaA
MLSQPFLVTPSNALAFRAVEACLRGDEEFRWVLLTGPRGAGKSALLRWAQTKAEGEALPAPRWEDPLRLSTLASIAEDTRLVATLQEDAPAYQATFEEFQRRGGRVFSMSLEIELTEAVARDTIAALGLDIDEEALRMLVDRLTVPSTVRGALQRLQAEAALAGRRRIDALFLIRSLGDYLFPSR